MNYGEIKTYDIANGEGVRVTLFVSGCRNHCFNCFQPQTWDFGYGQPFDQAARDQIFQALDHAYIQGLTLLGGDPFEPENQRGLLPLYRDVREHRPKKSIWVYTGYTLERDLLQESRARINITDEILSMVDVLVDGEFQIERKNISLKFRGSENQRLIHLPRTLAQGHTVLLSEDEV